MNWKKSEVLAVILIGGLLAAKALQKEKGHECKWPLCPYKEVVKNDWDSAVTKYTGERYTDAWCIDMLHLEFPKDEYVLRLCVCLPLTQGFNLLQILMGQIAQNRCYLLGDLSVGTKKERK